MAPSAAEALYEKHYGGDRARRGLFDALARWCTPRRVLYPGSFLHVTASFVFPSVVYVDTDRTAKRFFASMDDVVALVARNKAYRQKPKLTFHSASYEADFDEPEGSFDLLLSLYAGFISQPCKRFLKVGGVLAANDSHGDAGLASIDPDYSLIGVVRGRGDRLRVEEDGLEDSFEPKKPMTRTEASLRERGRGVAYTKSAVAYLFRRTR